MTETLSLFWIILCSGISYCLAPSTMWNFHAAQKQTTKDVGFRLRNFLPDFVVLLGR